MRIKYVRPIRFHQQFIVSATLVESANRLKIEYIIQDKASGEVLTKACTIQVAVDAATNELCMESPAILTDKLKGSM
jgi:acyl-CoA thioester hydrolase